MKPIIKDLSELSDSRELYDSRPNKVFTAFLALIICIITAAFVWMALGKIDEVIGGEGIIILSEDVSTITNTDFGKITKVYIDDGAYVNKGELLYEINCSELQIQEEQIEQTIAAEKEKLSFLYRYQKSIENNENGFVNEGAEQEYYARFVTYFINYETSKANITYTISGNKLSEAIIRDELDKQIEKLERLDRLDESIEAGKNLFDPVTETYYYSSYEKYCSDYKNIINEYDVQKQSILNGSTTEVNQVMIAYYAKVKSGYEMLQSSILNGTSYFIQEDEYSLKYEEYEEEIRQLAAQEEKDAYRRTYLIGIADNISVADAELQKLNTVNSTGMPKEGLLKVNENSKLDALNIYILNYKIQLRTSIIELENKITELNNQLDTLKNEDIKQVYYDTDGETDYAQTVYLKQAEMSNTIAQISEKEEYIKNLTEELEAIQRTIEKCSVKAEKAGYINLKTELVENDILVSGQTVMTILPIDSSEYKMQVYIYNKDIGEVKEGMSVKCSVYAFPNKEYGYLYGTITKISKDVYTDEMGISYYVAEADINRNGKKSAADKQMLLKVGMRCSVKAITGEKKIYRFVLEKLDLWK